MSHEANQPFVAVCSKCGNEAECIFDPATENPICAACFEKELEPTEGQEKLL